MYESKIEQLNNASMRVRKSKTSEKPFPKTQETFSLKAFDHLGRKKLAKPKCAMVKNFVTKKFMAKIFSPKIQRFKF